MLINKKISGKANPFPLIIMERPCRVQGRFSVYKLKKSGRNSARSKS
ncbi:MAG: hypothetical protein K0Q85_482 [Caproiciproducens sp.]|nr:hypothetical protein [Caproiciproducens sp.]